MANRKIYHNKNELPPNQEQQIGVLQRALKERYGFYRPVDEISAKRLTIVLEAAKVDINDYLANVRPDDIAELNINDDFGLTFVKQRRVGRQLFNAIKSGFSMGRAIERLESKGAVSPDLLEVPLDLDRLGWSPVKPYRKALVSFANSPALDELIQEQVVIDDVLSDLGLNSIVDDPSHLTLYRYGEPRDGWSLSVAQKHDILKITKESFIIHSLGSVSLKPLNIGPNYHEPCAQWHRATTAR